MKYNAISIALTIQFVFFILWIAGSIAWPLVVVFMPAIFILTVIIITVICALIFVFFAKKEL